MEKLIWKCILHIRNTSPLVHNIANYVAMNNSANAVLAIGASPVMSHAHSEIDEMVGICSSLVVNIGTLDEYWTDSMIMAAKKANQLQKPWILDPVGAGATSYRNKVLEQLLLFKPTVIRGNASEILALAKHNRELNESTDSSVQRSQVVTKGVDSTAQSSQAVAAARYLNREFGAVVCISGETDIIVTPKKHFYINNGSTLMTKVTGLGCSATTVIGAFIAGIDNKAEAVIAATALFSIAGEIAAGVIAGQDAGQTTRQATGQVAGPGTLQVMLLDKLYNITFEEIEQRLRLEVKDAE